MTKGVGQTYPLSMTGRRGASLPDAQPAATVFSVRVLHLLELRPHADGGRPSCGLRCWVNESAIDAVSVESRRVRVA